MSDDNHISPDTFNIGPDTETARQLADAQQRAPGPESELVFEEGMVLRMDVRGSSAPILLTPGRQTILGRRDPTDREIPDLDLGPYAAHQMGVSRHHAVIEFNERQLRILDLESRNGTYVNGTKLEPRQPHPLRNGDEIRIGKMVITLTFQQ